MYLIKKMNDLCNENYKTLIKEIEGSPKTLTDVTCL